jgi:hypothetical protein
MSSRTLIFALSALALGTGACNSALEPTDPAIVQQGTIGSSAGDDHGGLTGGRGADDPAGDDHGADDHGGAGGSGRGGADDPANHH